MDIENHRYWVAFDRPGLGKHAILDTEIRVSGASWEHVSHCDGAGDVFCLVGGLPVTYTRLIN